MEATNRTWEAEGPMMLVPVSLRSDEDPPVPTPPGEDPPPPIQEPPDKPVLEPDAPVREPDPHPPQRM